jgi:hypothetical protein
MHLQRAETRSFHRNGCVTDVRTIAGKLPEEVESQTKVNPTGNGPLGNEGPGNDITFINT